MIKKDLVLHAVLNPSESWPTRRRAGDTVAEAARGDGVISRPPDMGPGTAGSESGPRRNADPIRKHTPWEPGSCRLRGHGGLAQDDATARNSRNGTRKRDIT